MQKEISILDRRLHFLVDEALLDGLAELVQQVELARQPLLLPLVHRGPQHGRVLEEAVERLFPLVLGEQTVDVDALFQLAVGEAAFVPFGFLRAGLQFFILHQGASRLRRGQAGLDLRVLATEFSGKGDP